MSRTGKAQRYWPHSNGPSSPGPRNSLLSAATYRAAAEQDVLRMQELAIADDVHPGDVCRHRRVVRRSRSGIDPAKVAADLPKFVVAAMFVAYANHIVLLSVQTPGARTLPCGAKLSISTRLFSTRRSPSTPSRCGAVSSVSQ